MKDGKATGDMRTNLGLLFSKPMDKKKMKAAEKESKKVVVTSKLKTLIKKSK
jgi:hypothetical protein